MLAFLFWPFLACVVLSAIHGYLGLHVIERNIIFVDIAIAQLAALGGILAAILGFTTGWLTYLIALGCALLGSAAITWFSKTTRQLSIEVFIGILYVCASATAVLLVAKTPVESDTLKQMLTGNILVVGPRELFRIGSLYGAIGLVHFLFRQNFWQTTQAYSRAKPGHSFWDFLFYATFALVVTSSVQVAGVLLVFSFLIIPAAIASLSKSNLRRRIMVSWLVGILGSLVGIILSALSDTPTGPMIVVTYGLIFGGFYLFRPSSANS